MKTTLADYRLYGWASVACVCGVILWGIFYMDSGIPTESPVRAASKADLPLPSISHTRHSLRVVSPLESESQGRKMDLAKLYESLENPNGLNTCGKLLKEELAETDDYGSMAQFLSRLPPGHAKFLLKNWIFGIETRLGALENFRAQEKIVDELGFSNDMLLTDRFFRLSGGAAFSDLVPGLDVDLAKTRDFENAAIGSTEKHGVDATVLALSAFLENHSSDTAVDRSLSRLITSHSQEAAVAIHRLAPGRAKDLMIKALVEWMKRKGENDSLDDWISQISETKKVKVVVSTLGPGRGSPQYDPNPKSIVWDARTACECNNQPNKGISPATGLGHELAHALNHQEDPKAYNDRKNTPDD